MTVKRYAFTSAACAAAFRASNLCSSVPPVAPPVVPYPPPLLEPPSFRGGPPTLGGREEDCCGGAELRVRPGWEKASLSEEVEQRFPILVALIERRIRYVLEVA